MLHEVNNDTGRTAFCGPRAVAAITGLPITAIEKRYRRHRNGGYRDSRGRVLPIKSTYMSETIALLRRLGCKVERVANHEPTLGRLIEDTKHVGVPLLVRVPRHVCAVFQGRCSDAVVREKRQVTDVFRVTVPAKLKYTEPKPRPEKPKPSSADIVAKRYQRVLGRIKQWETKKKRAETALKKLAKQRRYYERTTTKQETSNAG